MFVLFFGTYDFLYSNLASPSPFIKMPPSFNYFHRPFHLLTALDAVAQKNVPYTSISHGRVRTSTSQFGATKRTYKSWATSHFV